MLVNCMHLNKLWSRTVLQLIDKRSVVDSLMNLKWYSLPKPSHDYLWDSDRNHRFYPSPQGSLLFTFSSVGRGLMWNPEIRTHDFFLGTSTFDKNNSLICGSVFCTGLSPLYVKHPLSRDSLQYLTRGTPKVIGEVNPYEDRRKDLRLFITDDYGERRKTTQDFCL
jgi:hypothetical protein